MPQNIQIGDLAKDCYDSLRATKRAHNRLQEEQSRRMNIEHDLFNVVPNHSIFRYSGVGSNVYQCNLCHAKNSDDIMIHEYPFCPAYFIAVCKNCHQNL